MLHSDLYQSAQNGYSGHGSGSNGAGVEDAQQDDSNGESECCELLLALGKLACAGSQSLQPLEDDSNDWKDMACTFCDATKSSHHSERLYWDRGECGEDWKDVVAAILAVIGLQGFRDSTKPRVYMALAIRRVFNHISDAEYLDLERSSLGEWLLSSMSRSLRELRISAV
jgi:serine/threonine-protein kinase ATR